MTGTTRKAHVGDWIEVHFMGGGAPRRGKILEVLGSDQHQHYRVRWIDDRESIFFPADGTHIQTAAPHADVH